MKKKKPLSTGAIVLIGFVGLLILGAASAIVLQPDNKSDVAQWFKVNYFPADEFGTTSIMDASSTGDVSSQEYKGSTSTAWMFTFIITMIALIGFFIFFARERKWI